MQDSMQRYLEYPTCTETGKRAFPTKKIPAEFRDFPRRAGVRGRLRVYLCKFAKHYHLTSWS